MTFPAPRAHSLKWRLIRRLLALQAALLSLLIVSIIAALYLGGHLLNFESEDVTIDALKNAVLRDANGGLAVRETPELIKLRTTVPGLWYILRDRQGHQLIEGSPPSHFARIGDALDGIGNARMGWNWGAPPRPNAQMRWVGSAAGEIQVVTGPGGEAPLRWLIQSVLVIFASFVLPALVVMALATLIATPMVVSRALGGLGTVAAEAERIDIDRQGTRLPTALTPTEVTPLVDAVNRALQRLDEGHSRRKRFLADAAHELRTPIAILQTRLETLPGSMERTRLLEDIARLAVMAEQLLDLQRLERAPNAFVRLDLVAIGRRVAIDLAPLAINAGYALAFDTEAERVDVVGDAAGLERVLVNLVQNAIQHGGRRGTITISVGSERIIDVIDEGPGIAAERRERVFEPFSRLAHQDRGAGLGLHLVREIVQLHGGAIAILDRPCGTCFRLSLPMPT
ncbi:HAMP domain-containing histidine kinase [Bosea sp. F3-2]|uniref:sensor histidine kinase n=1 Tax=Bosea sp. F3-2 TaxID=2599640 RepID=UPI0011EF8B01|nr:HAMP domain-containing sensor histidine kinase [Bosea sp. F3-2]QEL25442.1 HAMP domain-containing histidine kinase [Bosea sp. F3-2]